MRLKRPLFLAAILVLLAVACAQGAPEPGSTNMKATVDVAVRQTQTAVALSYTPTPKPSSTSVFDSPSPTDEANPRADEQPTSETAGIPSDWSAYYDEINGFSLSLPSSWTYIDLGKGDIEKLVQAAMDKNPNFGNAYSTETLTNMAAAGMKFLAIETTADSVTNGITTNMNIIQVELSAVDLALYMNLNEYAKLNEDQLQQAFGNDVQISSQVIELNGRNVLEMRYQTQLSNAEGTSLDVEFVQYMLINDKTQFIVTFSTAASQIELSYKTFYQIMQSFQIPQ